VHGRAIFYADRITGSMQRCLDETKRRREIQRAYNEEHGITPTTVVKSTDEVRFSTRVADARTEVPERDKKVAEPAATYASEMDAAAELEMLQAQMATAAELLDFEGAAKVRDRIFALKARTGGGSAKGGGALGRLRAPRA